MKKKFISLFMVAALVLSMLALAGCGKKVAKKEADPEPTTVKEMFAANKKANKKVDSVKFATEGDLKINADAEGFSTEIPANFNFEGASSKDMVHAKGSASLEMFGQKQDVNPEVYIDIKNGKAYACPDAEEDWTSTDFADQLKEAKESQKEVKVPQSIYDTLTFSAGEDEYKVEGDLSKVDIEALIKDAGLEEDQMQAALDSIKKANFKLDSGKLTITFDKKTKLIKKIDLADLAGSANQEVTEGQEASYSASLSFNIKFTDYNAVDPAELKIPQEALDSNAVSEDKAADELSIGGSEDIDLDDIEGLDTFETETK